MDANFRRLYSKYRGFTFPVVLTVFSIFLFFAVIVPVIKQTISIYQEAKVIADEVDILKKRLSVLQAIDEATVERQLVMATSAVPIEKSLPTILRTIDAIGGQTQVTVTNVSIDQPGEISTGSAKALSDAERRFGMHLLPFTVSLTGTYSQLKAFLLLSTQVRRFIRATEFAVDFTGVADSPDQITTQVLFDAFYSPLKLANNRDQIEPLLPHEEKTLSDLVGYPYVGEITLSQNSSESQIQGLRPNPFSR